MRLYRQHDLDLMECYRTEGFKFQQEAKAAFRAYADHTDYEIKMPAGAEIKAGPIPKMLLIQIYVDPKADRPMLESLSKVRRGQKNSFLKAVFRKYMAPDCGALRLYTDSGNFPYDNRSGTADAPPGYGRNNGEVRE